MKKNRDSVVYKTDSYKVSHWLQFVPGAKNSFYYIESRGGTDELMFAGLQPILKKLLFKLPTVEEVFEAEKFWKAHGLDCFNVNGWLKIIELGYFPLKIKAVTEGKVYKPGQVLITVETTVDGFEWLPGWFETLLLQVWYPITVATKSYKFKKIIYDYLVETGTPELIDFKLHSFGYRGVSSEESAGIGGLAELINFKGTDTAPGVIAAEEYYNATEMVGFSIPAAEHSTMTSWGKEHEFDAYRNMLDQFAKPGAIVAVVSDSYNLENAIKKGWCDELRNRVLESGATIVVRPDSGEPVEVALRTIRQLASGYGYTINDKGYKILNNVRIIQGDSIDKYEIVEAICKAFKDDGWSIDNIAFGIGGGSLQQVNRDTLKFAMKCSAIETEDGWQDVYKEPADAPWKASKKGRLDSEDLDLVYKNGVLVKEYTFVEVRENAKKYF